MSNIPGARGWDEGGDKKTGQEDAHQHSCSAQGTLTRRHVSTCTWPVKEQLASACLLASAFLFPIPSQSHHRSRAPERRQNQHRGGNVSGGQETSAPQRKTQKTTKEENFKETNCREKRMRTFLFTHKVLSKL